MIGGKKNSPRIIDEQQQFQTDRPLDRIYKVAGTIRIRHDAAASFIFHVQIAPLAAREFVKQMLPRTIGGDRDSIAEQHGTRVGGHVRVGVKVLRDFGRCGSHRVPIISTVRMILQVCDVGSTTFQQLHRFERRPDITRRAKIVAVQMHRMRQAEFINDLRESADNRARRDAVVAFNRVRELFGVFAPFPRRDTARIDSFDAVGLGSPNMPCDDVFSPFKFSGFQQVEKNLVVRHEHATGLVENRYVAHFFVRVSRGEHGNCGFVDGCPAHASVKIAGGKRRRCHSAESRAT